MSIEDLKSTFQYGMHGCGAYKESHHTNSFEAMQYWLQRGVMVFEIDIAKTVDDRFVALAHSMEPHSLYNVEINPYCDNSANKYSEGWFMNKKLCEKTTLGLTPMNLNVIVNVMEQNPEITVMFDLWGMWDSKSTYNFSKQLLEIIRENLKDRCVLEVYNKEMLDGIRTASSLLNVMYCVHGTGAAEFDENVNPEIMKGLGIDIISFPWACIKDHPEEIEEYHKNGFTIFSLSHDNRFATAMKKKGVNVNLVDELLIPNYHVKALQNRVHNKAGKLSGYFSKCDRIMREMTIEEAHVVTLEIMKEIHEFCVKNDIQYTLAYGSLLGAIRHKGFIPWDDDIDIWMTRPNFERFTKSFKSAKGYRHSSVYDKDSLICFDRVYETEFTYVKNMPKACLGKTGIWVDIMPLDVVPDEEYLRDKQYNLFAEFNKKVDIYRGWKTIQESKRRGVLFKTLIKTLFKGELNDLSLEKINKIHKTQLSIIQRYTGSKTSYYCFFQCGVLYRNEPQELLPSQFFSNYMLAKFEDTEFMIVQDYDSLLNLLYGNYMTPPPEGKRQKSHGVFMWK